MWSDAGEWITYYDGEEDREATFERVATVGRAFDPQTGEMTEGVFTWSGDAQVQLLGTDLSETEWTPNELEEALNTIFTPDSTGYPEPPADAGDGSDGSEGDESGGDVIDPYAGEEGWLSSLLMPAVSWFGGRRGDATDQAVYFTYGVGDELLLGTPRYFRQSVYGDYDQVDYDGNAYYAGGWGGTAIDLVSGAAVVKTGGKQLLNRLGHEMIGEGMETLAKRAPKAGAGLVDDVARSVFKSFDDFRAGRDFADLDEARKAWEVYQRTSKSSGLILREVIETYKHATNGWDVLFTKNWSPEINRAWLDGAIDAGKPIRLVGDASKIGSLGNPSSAMNFTRWEIGHILSRGYVLRNGMFVPK